MQHSTIHLKNKTVETSLRGKNLLNDPILNKQEAFSESEREALKLQGLLPTTALTLEKQLELSYAFFLKYSSVLERYSFLRTLQDMNETLFYALVEKHSKEMLPVIYTPGVGDVCLNFHKLSLKPRGLYIAYPDRDRIPEILDQLSYEPKVIVVTDGERILGLGDLGACGMGIPIGKISLYTACGGLHPAFGLPIMLDAGCDNEKLLNDPLYMGWKSKRVRGKEYDDFTDKFVTAIHKKFPNTLLQWEDFSKDPANMLLTRYQKKLPSFNDDIQGTAAVTLAGILAAVRAQKKTMKDQTVVIFGAGSAGTGIAHEIACSMQRTGLSEQDALNKIFLISTEGMLTEERLTAKVFQKPYLKPLSIINNWNVKDRRHITLFETVSNAKPTILIGVSTTFQAFNEELIKEMAKNTENPIIFPLSNPLTRCEAAPEDLIRWTDGRAFVATGTKFPDVIFQGKTYEIGQCNNYYIFPAMGLAVIAAKASEVTDAMFFEAALALSELTPAQEDHRSSLFPDPSFIQHVAKKVAFRVAIQAQKDGVAPKTTEDVLRNAIDENFWTPSYWKIDAT